MSITKVSVSLSGKVLLQDGTADEANGILSVYGKTSQAFDSRSKYDIAGHPNYKVTAAWLKTDGPLHKFKVD